MKFGLIPVLTAVSLLFSGYSYSNDSQQFKLAYMLNHNGGLILAGEVYGDQDSPVFTKSQKETNYISSVTLTYDSAGRENKEVKTGTIRSGFSLKASAKLRDGFVYSNIDFSYSMLSSLEKGFYGTEYPKVETTSISHPFFFKSGEKRVIDFCMSAQDCGYELSLQATESKVW